MERGEWDSWKLCLEYLGFRQDRKGLPRSSKPTVWSEMTDDCRFNAWNSREGCQVSEVRVS